MTELYDKAKAEFDRIMREGDPAVTPDPPEPVEKKYRVVGTTSVFEHLPGDEFTATLPFEQEENLIQYGHLRIVDEQEQPLDETEQQSAGNAEQSSTADEAKE